ncbi:hypothetical protein Bca4012_000624 [Brassica carinata]|uniref:Uncharacterized protein n=2 Tax=Brassica TaxID=3705 RepID=A0A3P6A9F6_BRAOL|nr:unnamed protein product [Brassica napus]CDY53623.1 BnaC03g71450D [Brassica napus]VDC86129.1 unnamed protein product [Brassica oleracea]
MTKDFKQISHISRQDSTVRIIITNIHSRVSSTYFHYNTYIGTRTKPNKYTYKSNIIGVS